MKTIACVLLPLALVAAAHAAEQAATNPPAAGAPVVAGAVQGTNTAKRKPLTAEERAEYNRLAQSEVELKAQVKLLNDLAGEHLRREEESRIGLPEKARWETDAGQELRDKSSKLLGQLNAVTKERVAFEAARGPDPEAALARLEERNSLSPDEMEYLMKLDDRRLRIRQEMVANDQTARALFLELQTNNSPDDMDRISRQLDENSRQSKQWEREQADLELKELEFRAVRNRMLRPRN